MVKVSMNKFLEELYKDERNESAIISIDKRIETLSPSLNWALNGGIVPGRFYVLTGPEGSGKSMLCASLVCSLLKDNPNSISMWFDTERSFNGHWVNVFFKGEDTKLQKNILVRATQRPSEIFDYFATELLDLINQGLVINSCVVDSVQQIIGPKEENKSSTEDCVMSDLASYLPGALRKIVGPARTHNIPWFFVSQVRDNFETAGQKYVSKEDKYTITGGRSFKHGVDVILLLEPAKGKSNALVNDQIKNVGGDALKIGHLIRGLVMKNRMGPIGRKAEFYFEYSKGIVKVENEIAQVCKNLGLVTVEGRTHYFDKEKIANSEDNYIAVIRDNLELQQKMLNKIRVFTLDAANSYKKELADEELIEDVKENE